MLERSANNHLSDHAQGRLFFCSQIIICPVQEQEINFGFTLPQKACLLVDFIICWHLFQRIHPSGVNEFNSLTARTSKRRAEAASSSSDANKALKQTKLLRPQPKKDKSSVTQSKLTELVLNVITEAMLPFSFVEQPSFKELIAACQPDPAVPSRYQVVKSLEQKFESSKDALKHTLAEVEFVATTADCWTAHRRSYLEVTAH